MTIRRLDLLHVAVPLRRRIKHASHERVTSDNLIVRATLADGTVGYGEGVPRSYVTGETVETAFAALGAADLARHVGDPSDFAAAVRRLEAWALPETLGDPRGMFGNAARCAAEVALLDAYGRKFGASLTDAARLAQVEGLRLAAKPGWVRYSGAVTSASRLREDYSAFKMWLYNFRHIKVKVGVDGQDDPRRLRSLRRIFGRKTDLRLDANEAWSAAELVERVAPLRPFRPSALEQPVPHREIASLAELRPQLGVPVMLDESLCGYPDAVASVQAGTADLLNVRLSKCGGLFPTLRIIGLAQRSGLGLQLGCHPGETGLLSAAGRHLASVVEGLRYVEGSYDRHVLSRNVTVEDLTFGYGGWARPLEGPGLGARVDERALESITVARKEVVYD